MMSNEIYLALLSNEQKYESRRNNKTVTMFWSWVESMRREPSRLIDSIDVGHMCHKLGNDW